MSGYSGEEVAYIGEEVGPNQGGDGLESELIFIAVHFKSNQLIIFSKYIYNYLISPFTLIALGFR